MFVLHASGSAIVGGQQWGPDGTRIYYRGPEQAIVERTLASGAERSRSLVLVPTEGGPPREVFRGHAKDSVSDAMRWTPDGRALLVRRLIGSRAELWLLPIDGASPRRVEIEPSAWEAGAKGNVDFTFSLSRDGRHLAFQIGRLEREVWALENLQPGRRNRGQ